MKKLHFAFLVSFFIFSLFLNAEEEPAAANEEEKINRGAISFAAGVDFTSHYFFRGLRQEDQGFIMQPYAEVTVAITESGFLNLDVFAGGWNSLHINSPTGNGEDQGFIADDPEAWYQFDFYFGAKATLVKFVEVSLSYYLYTFPNNVIDDDRKEVDLQFTIHDAELTGAPFSFSPYILVAFELEGQADGIDDEGIYLELGMTPKAEFEVGDGDAEFYIAIPLKFGMSLDNYYEDPNGGGNDQFFGYFDIGLELGIPLIFIPARYGKWETGAGVHFLFLGDNVVDSDFNIGVNNDEFEVVPKVWLKMEY